MSDSGSGNMNPDKASIIACLSQLFYRKGLERVLSCNVTQQVSLELRSSVF